MFKNIWHLARCFTTNLWWRHQMETFSALLALCAGNSPVNGEFPTQRPVTRSFDVFFDLRLNKQLSKQWWGWWSGTPTRSFWRQCNAPGAHDSWDLLTTTSHLRPKVIQVLLLDPGSAVKGMIIMPRYEFWLKSEHFTEHIKIHELHKRF